MKNSRFSGAFQIAAIYAIVGCLWILLSDKILFFLAPDYETVSALGIYKGWAFVGVTAYLLYWERKRADESITKNGAKTIGAILAGKPYQLIWLGIGLSIFFLIGDVLFDVFYFPQLLKKSELPTYNLKIEPKDYVKILDSLPRPFSSYFFFNDNPIKNTGDIF